MSDIAADDGRIRCGWARAAPAIYRDYHDHEWGRPVRGRDALFERLSLEAFQSGLSWLTILAKRDGFRRAFDGFAVAVVARYDHTDVQRLLADAAIVRNRAKIAAVITNARAAVELDRAAGPDFSELLWSFAPPPRPRPADAGSIPSTSPESTAMAAELKRRGFTFVGPTTAYALMQATGMVDDHLRDCFVAVSAEAAGRSAADDGRAPPSASAGSCAPAGPR